MQNTLPASQTRVRKLKSMLFGLFVTGGLLGVISIGGCLGPSPDHPAYRGLTSSGNSGPLGVHNNPTLKHMTPDERQRYANEWERGLQDESTGSNNDGPPPPKFPSP